MTEIFQMNRLDMCKKLEYRKSHCRFNSVLLQSLLLYHGPLVHRSSRSLHESNSDKIGHNAANPTCLTWNSFYISPTNLESLGVSYLQEECQVFGFFSQYL